MVSVRKRGKVYEYRFEIATVEGTRKEKMSYADFLDFWSHIIYNYTFKLI